MNLFSCQERACRHQEFCDYGKSPKACPKCGCKRYKIIFDFKGVNNVAENNPRWSASMGCSPEEIPLFQKLYPESEYHPETGDLLIKNRSHKKFEMKRRGFNEF
jgi:hypothetical protein